MSQEPGRGTWRDHVVPTGILVVFLLGFVRYACHSYTCRTYSDPRIYLDVARSWADGNLHIDYPPDDLIRSVAPADTVVRGCVRHIIVNEKCFSFVSFGYPLLLAIVIKLFGPLAVFHTNTGVLIAFFASLWWFVMVLFYSRTERSHIAVITVMLLFFLMRREIIVMLSCFRDPLAHTCLLLGLALFIRAMRAPGRAAYVPLFLSGVAVAGSACVRDTNIVAVAPMLAVWLVVCRRRSGLRDSLKSVSVFGASVFLGLLPWFGFNMMNSGNPLFPVQAYDASCPKTAPAFGGNPVATANVETDGCIKVDTEDETEFEEASSCFLGVPIPGIQIKSNGRVWRDLCRYMSRKYGWAVLVLAGIGFVLCVRSMRDESLLIALVTLVFALFVVSYIYFMWRYLFVIHPFVVALAACALVLSWPRLLPVAARRRCLDILPILGLLLLLPGLVWPVPPEHQLKRESAVRFKQDMEAIIPAGSLLIAERPIREMVDYLTSAHSVNPAEWLAPEHGIGLKRAVEYFEAKHGPVFFSDAEDHTYRHSFNHSPVTRELLLEHFDLVRLSSLSPDDYGVHDISPFHVYRIMPWSNRVVTADVSWGKAIPQHVQVNARSMWRDRSERSRAEVRFNGEPIGSLSRDGLNWFFLPSGLQPYGSGIVSVVSDQPMPSDLDVELIDWSTSYKVDVGPQAVPLDRSFLSEQAYTTPTFAKSGVRIFSREVAVRLPVNVAPGQDCIISGHVRLKGGAYDRDVVYSCTSDQAALGRIEPNRDGSWTSYRLMLSNTGKRQQSVTLVMKRDVLEPQCDSQLNQKAHAEQPVCTAAGVCEPLLEFGSLRIHSVPKLPSYSCKIGRAGDDLCLLDGFFERGVHDGQGFRWTGTRASMVLPVYPEMKRDYLLTIALVSALRPASVPVTSLNAWINGVELALLPEANGATPTRFRFLVSPEHLTPGLNEVSLAVSGWVPKQILGTKDDRRLGVAVERVSLSPASGISPLSARERGRTLSGEQQSSCREIQSLNHFAVDTQ